MAYRQVSQSASRNAPSVSWPSRVSYLLLFVFLIASFFQGATCADSASTATEDWRTAFRCGPNALYLFLRVRGWRGELNEIYDRVPTGKKGCSLLELQRASESMGISTAAFRTDIDGLRAVRMPVITYHTNAWSTDVGHFYFVTSIGRIGTDGIERVDIIDPISLVEKDILMHEFARSWTGYMLADQLTGGYGHRRYNFVLGVFTLVAAIGTWFWQRRASSAGA